jgi:macrolide transport system ATP-binding/permease protein
VRFEHWVYTLPLRLRSLFRRTQVDRELREELQDHLEAQINENISRGMSPEEARYSALRAFGGVTQVEEQCRERRGVGYIEDFLRDLRYGVQQARRGPGFSILAVFCLTLGIGANAAVFSWIEGLLLRPFPGVVHQEQLVVVVGTSRAAGDKGEKGFSYDDVSWPDFVDLRRNCTLIDAFIADKIMSTTLSIGDRAVSVAGSVVSSNYFQALGVRPVLGRGFEPGEEVGRDGHPVTVISYWMWKERFHGDSGVIGKTQLLNGVRHTIVGVAPKEFYGTFVGWPIQFWVPESMEDVFEPGGYELENRDARWIEGFARLKPGVSIQQAQDQVSAVAKQLEHDYPATNRGRGIRLLPLWKAPFNHAGELLPILKIALVAVFLVLVIACANVSNLLLVRSLARRREMTIRLAIGAGRARLVRQLLTEGLILATLAAAGGVGVAYWCRNLLVVFFPPSGSMVARLSGEIDWRVVAFSAGICALSALLFGLVPAIQTSKVDLVGALKSESGSVVSGGGGSRVRSGLVVGQVALGFVLMVGAFLLIRSMQRIRSASPGFSTQNVLITGVDLISARYDKQRAKNFQHELVERVQALGGVESAAWARVTPFSYADYSSAPIVIDGYQPAPDERPAAEYNQVGPGYFRTMGIPLLAGREFTRADNETAQLVAIVNEKMVAQYWRGENPVGRRLLVKGQAMRVIGVAKLVKYETYTEAPKPFFYVPLRQDFSGDSDLNIRTSRDPVSLAPDLAREVRALDAGLAPSAIMTLREFVNRQALASQEIAVALLSIFGGLALLLAAIGLYGVMSYAVSQSTRELGLRMALGAKASHVFWLVASRALMVTGVGVVIGIGTALALTPLAGNLLYKVKPHDLLAFGSAFVVMTAASLAACLLPAWRATRIDPARALRD